MAQISSLGALPDPSLHLPAGPLKNSSASASQKTTSAASTAATDETQASPLQSQLTRLSSALSSLQKNANNVRTQYVQALSQIRSGTYKVDSLDVSRSIVNDLLTSN